MSTELPDFDQAELLKALEDEEAGLLEDTTLPPAKPQRLTIQLIAERCLDPKELATLSPDALAEKMLKFQRLRLDRLRLDSMDGLDVCNAATHLHLQHNLIREIDGLDFFDRLQYLVVAHNQLTKLEGVAHLTTLQYLDASHNQIAVVAWQQELPAKLMTLELQGNPCADALGYRAEVLAALPTLTVLDEDRATLKELRAAGRAGLPEPEEDEEDGEEEEVEEGEDSEEGEEVEEADDNEGENKVGQSAAAPGWARGAARDAATPQQADDTALVIDAEQLYSRAMAAHGVNEGSEEFKAKVQAARKRVVDRVAEQRALQDKNNEAAPN